MLNIDEVKISIIIPTYNRAEKITRSIESVQNQPYKNVEIIVIDDCSSDNTPAIVKGLQGSDERIIYHRLGENSGVSAARNFGIDLAKGSHIGFLDSDDTYTEDFFLSLTPAFTNSYGEFDIATGYQTLRNEDTNCPISNTKLDLNKFSCKKLAHNYYSLNGDLLDLAFETKVITYCAALFSKKVIGETRFSTSLKQNEDSLFIRDLLLKKPNVLYCERSLLNYMIHDKNSSLVAGAKYDDKYVGAILGQIDYYKISIKRYPLSIETERKLRKKISRLYFWMLGVNYYRRHNMISDYVRCYYLSFKFNASPTLFLSFIKGFISKPEDYKSDE